MGQAFPPAYFVQSRDRQVVVIIAVLAQTRRAATERPENHASGGTAANDSARSFVPFAKNETVW
jgi:hypothetical protein